MTKMESDKHSFDELMMNDSFETGDFASKWLVKIQAKETNRMGKSEVDRPSVDFRFVHTL